VVAACAGAGPDVVTRADGLIDMFDGRDGRVVIGGTEKHEDPE
jgi:hypothetical protein